jgi:hypothetical protein
VPGQTKPLEKPKLPTDKKLSALDQAAPKIIIAALILALGAASATLYKDSVDIAVIKSNSEWLKSDIVDIKASLDRVEDKIDNHTHE